jgi:acylphosphatase
MASKNDSPTNPSADESVGVHLLVSGRVQGVGFRFFARETAMQLGVTGWVRNLPDGNVEAQAYGTRALLEQFIHRLQQGPAFSRVEHVEPRWLAEEKGPNSFEIRI